MTKETSFEFSYLGDNSIDINTLLASQFHFTATLSEIQKELYPDVEIKIKISAFKEGSFVVQLIMETSFLQHLFTKENVEVALGILGGFKGIVELHKMLKGKKPEAIREVGDNIEITNSGTNSPVTINKQVYNIYKYNTTVSQSLQRNFEVLENDQEIEGIAINEENGNEPLLVVPQEDFHALAQPNPFLDREQNEETYLTETVYIKKPNLMPEKKKVWNWELVHKGRDIKAKITDQAFEAQINNGLRVAQGDRLIVDLKIFSKWSEQFNCFIESGRFEIVKVHKLVERPTAQNLFPPSPPTDAESI